MGRGISGVIPVVFHFEKRWGGDDKDDFIRHSPKDFFDFYDEFEQENKTVAYRIKSEMLLPSFKDFYFGFHTLIDNQDVLENSEKFNEAYDAIVKRNDLKAFLEHFSESSYYDPRYMSGFSMIACQSI
jgi:hypothetical protein